MLCPKTAFWEALQSCPHLRFMLCYTHIATISALLITGDVYLPLFVGQLSDLPHELCAILHTAGRGPEG